MNIPFLWIWAWEDLGSLSATFREKYKHFCSGGAKGRNVSSRGQNVSNIKTVKREFAPLLKFEEPSKKVFPLGKRPEENYYSGTAHYSL